MQSPQRTHSGEFGRDIGSSFKLHACEQLPQAVHFSLSHLIFTIAMGFNSAYIAPSGQSTLQKKRYTGTDTTNKHAARDIFQIVRAPAILRKTSFVISSGMAPKIVPDGHMNLQNHGSPKPDSSCRTTSGNRTTNTASTTYFKYLAKRSLTFNFGVFILYNKSWSKPIGQT